MFEKITIIQSEIVAINVENIDTDQIIPARFLKQTSRNGFGKAMFMDWRFTSGGEIKTDSVFAKWDIEEIQKPKILVAGKNFGCGSSREHAAWAIADYGFQAVVSSFFADIFKANALNNGLLPIQVGEEFLSKIFKTQEINSYMELRINLQERTIEIVNGKSSTEIEYFPINTYKQQCLLNGLEDIDYLLSTKPLIENYEKTRK